MRIPYTVPRNVYEAYRCSEESSRLPNEAQRVIRTENRTWDEGIVPELKILAIRAIASTWRDNPLFQELPSCMDRNLLLEILPTDLPLNLVIEKINDGFYWKRYAEARWQNIDPFEHGASWRRVYCERHFSEYVENIQPSYFEGQKKECDREIDLVRDHVHVMRIRCLQPCAKQSKNWLASVEDDPCALGDDLVDHVPLNSILPRLQHLREIYINFGMIYFNDGFEWRDFEFSMKDSTNLGEALKNCPNLRVFHLIRSNLNQPRAAAVLQGLAKNESLEILDFSHCKLEDTGAHAVAEFLSRHRKLRILRLTNNNIGYHGLAGIVHGLFKADNNLMHLDLRLNPLEDAGAQHICAFLLRNKKLEELNFSGCGFTVEGGTAMADLLTSGLIEIERLSLDLSNNEFDDAVGRAFEIAIKACPCIIGFDVRMCNFSQESEYSIYKTVLSNKEEMKKLHTNEKNV